MGGLCHSIDHRVVIDHQFDHQFDHHIDHHDACRYILQADNNEDIIMNSLAAVFVLEIDDYAYSYFITDSVKHGE